MVSNELQYPPWVLIVTGPPGAGKTSLARPLAEQMGLPLICKDDLKEILFEALGWGDRATSRAMSDAAYEVMFHLTGVEMAVGRSLMLEANFRPEAKMRLDKLRRIHHCRFLQIRCAADPRAIVDRLVRRAEQRLRHPGHLDEQTLPEMKKLAAAAPQVDIEGPVIEVDTTDSQAIDPVAVARRVKALMREWESQ